jgi:hypothetical protein
MRFEQFIKIGKVKKVSIDLALAKGLIQNAYDDFNLIKNEEITNENASFYLKNCYDCLRSALQSFLTIKGYKSYSHEAIIIFSSENNIISKETANKIDKFRILRNDIEYRAKRALLKETNELISITKTLLPKLNFRLKDYMIK